MTTLTELGRTVHESRRAYTDRHGTGQSSYHGEWMDDPPRNVAQYQDEQIDTARALITTLRPHLANLLILAHDEGPLYGAGMADQRASVEAITALLEEVDG